MLQPLPKRSYRRQRPRTLSQYDLELLKLWEQGAVVGVYSDSTGAERIGVEWAGFLPGELVATIWNWFDNQFYFGLAETVFEFIRFTWVNHPYLSERGNDEHDFDRTGITR